MNAEYKELPEEYNEIFKNAWSVENMAAHDAGGRTLEYIGSRTAQHLVYELYRDSAGAYWYQTKAKLPNGEIVSMEIYLFKRNLPKRKAKK